MPDVNDDAPAQTGQRATAESIERGGSGLDVDALLARVRSATTPPGTGPHAPAEAAVAMGVPAPESRGDGDTAGADFGSGAGAGGPGSGTASGARSRGTSPGTTSDGGAGTASRRSADTASTSTDTESPGTGRAPGTGRTPGPASLRPDGADALRDVEALAAAIAAAAAPYVPDGHLPLDADFFDAGGSSVGAVELVAELERMLRTEVGLDDVFADARPRSLARRWLSANGAGTVLAIPITPEDPVAGTSPAAPSTPAGGKADAGVTRPSAPATGSPTSADGRAVAVTTHPATHADERTAVATTGPAISEGASPAPPAGPRLACTARALPAVVARPLRVPSPRTPPVSASAPEPDGRAAAFATARSEDLDQILADLALADRLPWTGAPEPLPPRRILLTGATGFLGGHMLLDLLRHTDAHVHCLVRAADEETATARLGEQLRSYRLPWSSEVRRRVTVLPGDIRSPRLGLSDELWDTLADELDSVVGVAAAVDFLRGYQSLRRSNVLGALTLAELAATGRPKPLHHISSIAVFNEVGIASIGEDDPLARVDRLVSGYDQSKWVAEVALRRARDHGLVVTALRPGGIGGHTRTGAHNPQDLSSGLISAFGRFRTVPAFRHLNAAPVDWVSRVAVAAVCDPDAWGYDYNLTGVPNTLDDVVRDMALGGMHVRVQGWDEWRGDTLDRLDAEPVPELAFLGRVLRSPTALKLCEATLTGPAATDDRTAALVESLGLPGAARYDARAQLGTFERLAEDGLARLPGKDDHPYLWFAETAEGSVGPVGAPPDVPCSMALTLSIASMYQLVKERRVDVAGTLTCTALHPEPLTVELGDLWVRPEEGIPQEHGMRHQLLRYRLSLRDADGGRWWLEGHKYARARRDVWRQARALTVEIGREGEPATLAGEMVVPADRYVRDQIDGIKVDPRLTGREKRAAKLTWLAWFGAEVGRGLLGPFARAAADLLDLRRTPTLTEHKR
ncbi:thioester reductase domain-containing protein [Streptomyces sp. 142MFCol3.1]|uniref:thioester reductase domain-containing protein n=1 Tax=Streptomyces sp. 142MFCol3.1 TaxID=1172179 RepID=UPI00041DECBD|nr:thioester reductase domain-containing protein [Streptomyces sp. 142MFCol3.1]